MRIASLLPSLTELVCALGRRDDLVGVTHECDFPPGVERLSHLTRSRIPTSASSRAIDAMVSEQAGQLYELDVDLLARLEPDLILTQTQCDVCAVNETTVRRAAAALPGSPRVESVNPTCLAEVQAMFRRVGELLGARDAAEQLVEQFRATAAEIARRVGGQARPVTVLLEWLDPPFCAGHWNPELIGLAGGQEPLGRPGQPSRRVCWDDLDRARPEVLIVAPCGFTRERTMAEWTALASRAEWTRLPAAAAGRVIIADGSAFFSRPGPRLEESLRIAAAAVHPSTCGDMADVRFQPAGAGP